MSESINTGLHEKQLRMETGKILPLIFYFGLPGILSQLVQTSYSLVDTMFVGIATGDLGLAAINISFPAIIFFVAFAVLVSMGPKTLFGIKLGEKDYDTCAHIFGTSLVYNSLLSLIITGIVLLFTEPILRLSGASDALMGPAKTYFMIYGGFFISQNLGYTVNEFISSSGHPNRALLTHVISALSNIVLDYLFIIQFDWGIAGAAWASIIAWTAACFFALQFFFSAKCPFKLKVHHFRPQFKLFSQGLKYGLPLFLMQIGNSLTLVIILRTVAYYGSLSWLGTEGAVAIYGVIGKGYQTLILAAVGLAIGCAPLFSYNLGARKFKRLLKIFIYLCIISFLFTFVLWLPVVIYSFELVSIFGLSTQYLDYASKLMRIDILLAPIIAFEIITSILFTASGKYIQGAILQLMRSLILICIFTLSFPILLPPIFDLAPFTCIIIAEPATDIVLLVLTVVLLTPLIRQIKAVEQGKLSPEEAKLLPPVH